MKRRCSNRECGKKFVTSKKERKLMKEIAPEKGDENLCHACFRDSMQIAYDQSYFGSIHEWGA